MSCSNLYQKYPFEVPFQAFVSLNNDKTNFNMADGDHAGDEYIASASPNFPTAVIAIDRMALVIRGNGSSDYDDYGEVGGGLSVGITIGIRRGAGEILTLIPTLLTNEHLITAFDIAGGVSTGSGNNVDWMQKYQITFQSQPVMLNTELGDEFVVVVGDNISANVSHTVYIRGRGVNLTY